MSNIKNTSSILGRLGNLVVKIAETNAEIEEAQKLRHAVFKSETANVDAVSEIEKDEDYFDQFCDHLIVLEENGDTKTVVATYRLMGEEQASSAGRFYSQSEFDVKKLLAAHPKLKFLELGRSCVLPAYRTKRTIELLWHGSWAYVRRYRYDVMFGCASFAGTDQEAHAAAFAFLASNAAPEENWNVRGIGETIEMDAFDLDLSEPSEMKKALRSLPPLIKGYLRLGAMFAKEAVIDRDFGSIDVLVLLPVSKLNPRYVSYYGENAERHKGE